VQYTYAQLEQLWIQAGGSKILAPLMAAIAEAESSGNSDALNPNDNNGTQTSVGLWQVSNGTHNYPAAWLTPEGNAREAVNKLQTQGITAWGTYTSGAYKKFLRGGVPPDVGTLVGGPVPQAGGLGGFVSGVWSILNLPIAGAESLLGSASAIAQAIAALAAPLVKIAEAIDWFFHPAHWIRLFAGIAGGVLVLGGVWQMSHAGGA
jgi:hypothetical protein